MKTIFIASGGTGGHIFPGLLLAKRMKKDFKIYFVGNEKGMEYGIVKKYGYEFLPIPSYGFVGKPLTEKVKSALYNVVSLLSSIRYITEYKPEFVIGTGSFTELPVGFAAKLMRIPVYITEQDSYPGIATRLLSMVADRVFLSYEGSMEFLRRKDNVSI
ncbi:MAG: undecaprenyldiphospho-muramoylpentapeptide beta-N-acetylglucosaminyltransferase, partial [Proteobacteria bacterium]|nr:undecaprenyldiphospho-muramoylpentapeptide beta-N-acetylglucosaminyltransferase [Pseudomonadota bacterium]